MGTAKYQDDMATWRLESPMLRTSEAARLLHVHENTLRRWADTGMIRSYRISARGDRRFHETDIAHFVQGAYLSDKTVS